jgi:hypothetical protein
VGASGAAVPGVGSRGGKINILNEKKILRPTNYKLLSQIKGN